MRSVFLGLIILLLASGFAAGEDKGKTPKESEGFKKERVVKLRAGLYTKMYVKAYYKTKLMELDKEQRRELNRVAKKHSRIIMSEENKARELQRDFMTQLEISPFSSSKLTKIAADLTDAQSKAIDSFIIGMADIEKIIGPENFAKLTPISKFDRSSLVQLKQGSADNPLGDGDEETEESPGEADDN